MVDELRKALEIERLKDATLIEQLRERAERAEALEEQLELSYQEADYWIERTRFWQILADELAEELRWRTQNRASEATLAKYEEARRES